MGGEQLARGLGWFSIGLGLAEIAAAPILARTLGLAGRERLIRAYGLREIANGGVILSGKALAPALWARVGGDALDLATLGLALRGGDGRRGATWGAIGAVAGVTAADIACALQPRGAGRDEGGDGAHTRRSLPIGKPADELYQLWREPGTLSQLLGTIGSVEAIGNGRARWTIGRPIGGDLTWESTIVEERPGELLRWRSVPDAPVASEGSITFRPAPGDWGTIATLDQRITPPGGPLGAIASLAGKGPMRLLTGQLLHRFKSLAETGEIPTLSGQPAARDDGRDK